jgi:hypothetical protein
MASFTLWPLYPLGKSPRYLSGRNVGGPQNCSGRRGEEENIVPTGTQTPTPRPPSPYPMRIEDGRIVPESYLYVGFYIGSVEGSSVPAEMLVNQQVCL